MSGVFAAGDPRGSAKQPPPPPVRAPLRLMMRQYRGW